MLRRVPLPSGYRASFCEDRGHHGPFLNRQLYDHFPGWEGMGDCVVCGSTRMVGPPGSAEASPAPLPETTP